MEMKNINILENYLSIHKNIVVIRRNKNIYPIYLLNTEIFKNKTYCFRRGENRHASLAF